VDPLQARRPLDATGGEVPFPGPHPTGLERVPEPALPLHERRLGMLPLGDVLDVAREGGRPGEVRSHDRQLDGEARPVAAPTDHLDRLPQDPGLPGVQVPLETSAVILPQVVGDDQLGHLSTDRLVTREAEEPLRRRVPLDDHPPVVDRDHGVEGGLQDRRLEGVALLHRLDCGDALEELAELASHRVHRFQQGLVGRQGEPMEELHRAQDPLAAADREGEGGPHARLGREPGSREVVVLADVRNPARGVLAQNPSGESLPRPEDVGAARLDQGLGLHSWAGPEIDEPEDLILLVEDPDVAGVPSDRLPHLAQESDRGLIDARGLGQHPGRGVLCLQALLDAAAVADVDRERDRPLPPAVLLDRAHADEAQPLGAERIAQGDLGIQRAARRERLGDLPQGVVGKQGSHVLAERVLALNAEQDRRLIVPQGHGSLGIDGDDGGAHMFDEAPIETFGQT